MATRERRPKPTNLGDYLIIFEIKRGTLSRDAVAQIIDYASFLDSLDRDTQLKHITDQSGY